MKAISAILARAVGGLLLWAAVGKIAGFEAFSHALSTDTVLPWHPAFVVAIPATEAALAFALISSLHRRAGAWLALVLFCGFAAYHAAAIFVGAGAGFCLAGLPGTGRSAMLALCLSAAGACAFIAVAARCLDESKRRQNS